MPEQVCLRLPSSVWVLDFVYEKFHGKSPGDFEGMFFKAEDSKIRKGLV